MDRTGARWSLIGAEAVLRLRAIRASKDFDAYRAFHLERDRERNHASRYEGGKIPDPLPAPKPRLKRGTRSISLRSKRAGEEPHPNPIAISSRYASTSSPPAELLNLQAIPAGADPARAAMDRATANVTPRDVFACA